MTITVWVDAYNLQRFINGNEKGFFHPLGSKHHLIQLNIPREDLKINPPSPMSLFHHCFYRPEKKE